MLVGQFRFTPHGTYLKMSLVDPRPTENVDVGAVEPLGPDRLDELREFYRVAYAPREVGGTFFAPYMLETGCYVGIRERGRLVSVAGVHVYSPRYRVAALGNIVTRPESRGRGLARATTAGVLTLLRGRADNVGLNVKTDNAPAIRCYELLGFRPVCEYTEGIFTRREGARNG